MNTAALAGNIVAWSAQAAIVIAAGAVVLRVLRVHAPAVRHGCWRLLLVACLALPLVQPWRPYGLFDVPLPAVDDSGDAGALTVSVVASLARGHTAAPSVVWPLGLLALVGTGALVRLAWLGAGILRLRGLRRIGASASFDAAVLPPSASSADIRFVDDLRQPVTFGVRQPVVLLPTSLRAHAPGIQRAVVEHELWHVRRGDWGWSLAEEILRALLWFHPAVWWLITRIQATREEVVDALTVATIDSRRSYLEALLLFADEPSASPAAPFAERRHLFQRMLLISREAVMSSRRIVLSAAVMVTVVAASGWYGAAVFPLTAVAAAAAQTPPRDPRGVAQAPSASEPAGEEAALKAAIKADPTKVDNYRRLAIWYTRNGRFDDAIATLEDAAVVAPANPASYQVIATYYWEKASKDPALTPGDRLHYIQSGINATNRALELNPDYFDALTYKSILMRMQASLASDASEKQQLAAEADALRTRALELRPHQTPVRRAAGLPPPPPPPPPPGADLIDGVAPLRVGGNIKVPTKIRDARPIYPEDAKAAGIQGVVILEIRINTVGTVVDTRVLRSIPQLDQAAVDAVRQWQFEPVLLNGKPVPIMMTVTVNFRLE